MRPPAGPNRLARVALALAAAMSCAALTLAAETSDPGHLATGRRIYRAGVGTAPITVRPVEGGPEFAATRFACMGCHGIDGLGSAEGGLRPPPIDARALGGAASERVLMAVAEGHRLDGRRLRAMPSYTMSDRDRAALSAYLAVIGTEADLDPGLAANEVRVGVVLPPEGRPGGAADAVAAAVEDEVARANAAGGIYGRRLVAELIRPADEAEAVAAVRRVADSDAVFALVASQLPDDPALFATIARAGLPVIGPLRTPAPVAGPLVYDLAPSLRDQARALVEYAALMLRAKRVAVLWDRDAVGSETIAGFDQQARLRALDVAARLRCRPKDAPATNAAVAAARPDAVFVFAPFACAAELEAGPPILMLVPAGQSLSGLPPALAARLVLARPGLPGHDGPDALARGAVRVLAEALSRAGRRLSRERLCLALDGFREVQTGVLPPVSFGVAHRTGVAGASIVALDQSVGAVRALAGWISPP